MHKMIGKNANKIDICPIHIIHLLLWYDKCSVISQPLCTKAKHTSLKHNCG